MAIAIATAVGIALTMAACSRRTESTPGAVTSAASGNPTKTPAAEEQHSEPIGGEPVGVVNAWLFVASPDEISRTFAGWGRPLPLLDQFVTRTERNPFTATDTTVRTRIPETAPRATEGAVAQPDLPQLAPIGRKGLEPLDIQTVGRAALDWDADNARSETYGRIFAGPPDAPGVLLEVAPALTTKLAALSPTDAHLVATRWAALFRKDTASIENVVVREQLLATPDSVFATKLADLTQVARKAVTTSRAMYLWTLP